MQTKSLPLSGEVSGLCQDNFKDLGTFLTLMAAGSSHITLHTIQIVQFISTVVGKHTRGTQEQHVVTAQDGYSQVKLNACL